MRYDEFGALLRQLMDSHSMNGADLCRRLGVNKSSVHHWRRGNQRPEPAMVAKIADLFGYDRLSLLQLARWLPDEPQPLPDPYRLVKFKQLDAWLNAVGAAYEAFFWRALEVQAGLVTDLIVSVSRAALGLPQPAEPAISTHDIGPLACSCLFCRPGDPGVAGGPSEPLAILLSLPLAS